MDPEQTVAALLSENRKLGQENNHLKSVLGLVKENQDLRAQMQSFNNDSLEECAGIVFLFCHQVAAGVQWQFLFILHTAALKVSLSYLFQKMSLAVTFN